MDFNNLSLGSGLLLSLFSMAVVFVVLLAITLLVDGTAFFLKSKKKKEDPAKILNQPDTTDRTGGETCQPQLAALMAAAVAAYAGDDTRFVVKRIRRQETGLSGWESAGIQEGFRRSQ